MVLLGAYVSFCSFLVLAQSLQSVSILSNKIVMA